MRWASVVAVCVLVSGCGNRSPIKASESLVGAKELPPAKILSRETIEINRGVGSGPSAPGSLEYEFRPDNSLSITHTKVGRDGGRLVAGRETLVLSSRTAADARRLLWRLRPQTLRGIGTEVLPIGCPPPPIDSFPEFFVDFISEGPKPGIGDDKLGIVFVPIRGDCRTRQAAEAHELLQKVLQSFPASKVRADFDNEVAVWRRKLLSD